MKTGIKPLCPGLLSQLLSHPEAYALGAVLCLAVAPSMAAAAGGGKGRPDVELAALLQKSNPAEQQAALDALGERGDRPAVEVLTLFLRQGQPDSLTDRALLALGKTRSRDALPVLSEFARHRRTSARLAAYDACSQIGGESAFEMLARGLRDSDAAVRGLSATRLGERGAKSQLELLFRALERDVPEASVAIGRLGDGAAAARLHAYLGKLPIQVMLNGYEQFLERDEINEEVKLEIVARLGEVAGVSVKRFLERMQVSKNGSRQPRLQKALAETARRIDDRPTPKASKP